MKKFGGGPTTMNDDTVAIISMSVISFEAAFQFFWLLRLLAMSVSVKIVIGADNMTITNIIKIAVFRLDIDFGPNNTRLAR